MPLLAHLGDLAQRRAALARHLAVVGAERFAEQLEPLVWRATQGHGDGRETAVAMASWVAHSLDAEGRSPLVAVGEAARARGLELLATLAVDEPAEKRLGRRGRLADVGVARARSLVPGRTRRDPGEPVEAWRERTVWTARQRGYRFAGAAYHELERFRMHHEPSFVARVLDARWARLRDVVVIASRRPTTPAIVLAVATRDRWLADARVQAALVTNPFAPASLVNALLPVASEADLVDLASGGAHARRRAAAQVLLARGRSASS